MSEFSSTAQEQLHYVYRQTTSVVLSNEELTKELFNLNLRVAFLEEVLAGKLNIENESNTSAN